jgi:hypothetical protein
VTFGAFSYFPLRLGGTATEGWPAPNHARFCADLVAMKRVMPLASWSYNTTDGVTNYHGMMGTGAAHAPTVTVNGTGDYSFQWALQSFEDDYGIEWPFKIRHAIAGAYDNGGGGTAAATPVVETLARGIRVRMQTVGGIAGTRGLTVKVW